jgi:monoamine oxidase
MVSAIMLLEMQLSSSMAAAVSLEIELKSPIFNQIQGGMDYLPKGFLGAHQLPIASQGKIAKKRANKTLPQFPDLASDIRYNSRVIEISNQPPDLVLVWKNTVTGYERHESFDLAVIALPFSALRHVRMLGLASPEKRRAMRQLHYANACKILLEFERMFWANAMPEHMPIKGGHSITDLPIRHICYPSEQQYRPNGHGLLLASYTWGDDSLRWTSLRHEDRIRFALRDLERVHNLDKDSLLHGCIGGMSHSWAEDEFTSGAFAEFEPYQRIQLFPDIWRPEPPIYYCGEHASSKHGWIEGAIESGIRVALEII